MLQLKERESIRLLSEQSKLPFSRQALTAVSIPDSGWSGERLVYAFITRQSLSGDSFVPTCQPAPVMRFWGFIGLVCTEHAALLL